MGSILRRAVALAVTAAFLSAGVAFASPGHGTTVTQFTAFDICEGQRIVKSGPHPSVEDKEICRVGQNPLIPVGRHDVFEPGIDGWFSDYDAAFTPFDDPVCAQPISTDAGFCFHLAISGTVNVTKDAHGNYTWHADTYY